MSNTRAQLRAAIEAFRPSAGMPVPSDPWTAQYFEMAGAHTVLLNALLAIYEQAPGVPKQKHTNFIGFCLLWGAILYSHHQFEEETYFALYEPKIDTSFVREEHETFQKGVSDFESYLVACLPPNHPYGLNKTAPATQEPLDFDGVRLQQLIDSFVTPLSTHLAEEITHLEPEKLKAAGLTEGEMRHIAKVTQAQVRKYPLTRFLTFAILCQPKWTNFPPVPGFIRSFLVPYVLSIPYKNFWEFVPKND